MNHKLTIGCHISSAKGFYQMGLDADKIDANCFQFFTRNPRGGKAKVLDLEDLNRMMDYSKAHGISHFLAHAPYTLNACAKEERLRTFAYETMLDDLQRLEHLSGAMYNFHPGSHVQQGAEVGIQLIADHLNRLNEHQFRTSILLETMSGKGSEVGRNFQELRAIIDKVEHDRNLGVCLDTCHVFDGGYDIVDHLDEVLQEFDRCIGLDRLKAIHLNDSMNELGSHKDRHARIGEGTIGQAAMARIINHEQLKNLPFYLETPNELEGHGEEIAFLRKCYTKDRYMPIHTISDKKLTGTSNRNK
ncbi:MAG: deoxyribonuclease IV [Lachnospiraceae bacterium]|nr:deoxyribonuclease IV [Lachnospiraceae bacterium]